MTPSHRRLGILLVTVMASMLWMSWPLPVELGDVLTSGRADGDLGYTLSAHWWAGEVLSGQANFPVNDLVYFPHGQNMAGSVWNFVPLFLSAWTHWFLDPLGAYHAATLFLMLLNGLAAALLGTRLGGFWGGLGAALTLLAFPFPWAEAFEGRLEQAFLAPAILVFWAAIAFREAPQKHARTLGVLMGLVAACYWFYAPIVSLGLAVFLGKTMRTPAVLAGLSKALGFTLVTALPFGLLILPAIEGGAFAQATSDAQHILYTRAGQSLNPWESFSGGFGQENLGRTLPLVCSLSIGLFAIGVRSVEARRWVAVALLGAVFAMGPVLSFGNEPWVIHGRMIPLPFGLLDAIPGLTRFWWPYRFLLLVGVAAAAGMALLFCHLFRTRGRLAPIVMAVLLLIEGRIILVNATQAGDPSIPASPWDPEPQGHFYQLEVPEWMETPKAPGALLEFPMSRVANAAPLFSPFHQLPTAHGDGIRERHIRPRAFEDSLQKNPILSAWAQGEVPNFSPESLAELHNMGFRYILVHTERSTERSALHQQQALLRQLQATVGSPEHQEAALSVFAIPSTRLD